MTEPVRVHIRVPGTDPMPRLMKLIQSIEAAGFDGAGILDSQMLSRDTFVVLGQAAAQTTRLALFPAVTNPFTRHASVLASAIQTVEELAPGRVRFVIGTGYTSASTIGRSPATLADMRACIGTVKALLGGKTVDFGGTPGRLGYVSGRHIPVLMAASGAKAIEVAGEIADGVLLLVGFNRGIVTHALELLERGARRGGRRLEDLEIIWAVRTATLPTTAEARRLARPTAVHWGILRWGGYWLGPAGLKLPKMEKTTTRQRSSNRSTRRWACERARKCPWASRSEPYSPPGKSKRAMIPSSPPSGTPRSGWRVATQATPRSG